MIKRRCTKPPGRGVRTIVYDTDRGGRLPVVPGQPFDGGQIGALGVGGEVLEFHGPDHLLTQLGHVTPPGVWVERHPGGILA